MKATEVTAVLAESNGSLLPAGLWRDSLHLPIHRDQLPGPTLGNEYGKTLLFIFLVLSCSGDATFCPVILVTCGSFYLEMATSEQETAVSKQVGERKFDCVLCSAVSNIPRLLPCTHTNCMNCLQRLDADRKPGRCRQPVQWLEFYCVRVKCSETSFSIYNPCLNSELSQTTCCVTPNG